MSLDVGTLNAYLKLDSTQFTASLLAAQAKTREFSASISESGESVAKFGAKLNLAITLPPMKALSRSLKAWNRSRPWSANFWITGLRFKA